MSNPTKDSIWDDPRYARFKPEPWPFWNLAVNSQETAKKVLQDLEVVEYKREGAELIKLGN